LSQCPNQKYQQNLDSRLRGNDGRGEFGGDPKILSPIVVPAMEGFAFDLINKMNLEYRPEVNIPAKVER
jgi:hypothetical protein